MATELELNEEAGAELASLEDVVTELAGNELAGADELASLDDAGVELGAAEDAGVELVSTDELVCVMLDEDTATELAATELGAALLGSVGDLLPPPPPQATRLITMADNSPC